MKTSETKTANNTSQETTMTNPTFSLPTSHSTTLVAYLNSLNSAGPVDVDGRPYYSHRASLVSIQPSTRIHGLDSEVRTSKGWYAKVLVWAQETQGTYQSAFHYIGIDAFGRLHGGVK